MDQKSLIPVEEANQLVIQHKGWAESIAKNIARSWNLDWQQDGLDGAALEALMFCSRRYDPEFGVPFKSYARKRIHEASAEAARKSKGWRRKSTSAAAAKSLDLSHRLMGVFPGLRMGQLPMDSDNPDEKLDAREGVRTLLVGASLLLANQASEDAQPDEVLEFKRVVEHLSLLEAIHQMLMWKVYWEGQSMRGVATEWETDELNVIREHKSLLKHLQKSYETGKALTPLRVRPGLKDVALRLKKVIGKGPFSKFKGELSDNG